MRWNWEPSTTGSKFDLEQVWKRIPVEMIWREDLGEIIEGARDFVQKVIGGIPSRPVVRSKQSGFDKMKKLFRF